jgi:hypothetical protein
MKPLGDSMEVWQEDRQPKQEDVKSNEGYWRVNSNQ